MAVAASPSRGATIREVEVLLVSLPKIKPFQTAHGYLSDEHVFVKVLTEDGVVGWGDSGHFLPPYAGERPESTFITTKFLAQSLVGRSVFDIAALHYEWDDMILNNNQAKCALDLALHDAATRTLGISLAEFLGGAQVDRLPVQQNVPIGSVDEILKDVERLRGLGIGTIGTKAGRPASPSIEHDVTIVRAIREKFGYDFDLWIDFNGGSDRNEAVRAIKRLEEFDISQVEQPVPGWDVDGLAYVTQHVAVAVVADEPIWGPQSVVDIARRNAADVIHTKLPKVGGIWGIRRVAAICSAVGLPLNVAGFGIANYAQAALMQFLSTEPIALRYAHKLRAGGNSYKSDVVTEVPSMIDGAFPVPTGVGFGIEMNVDAVVKRTLTKWSTKEK